MKSFKTHFGVIISLIALLFSMQFGIFIANLTKIYGQSIQNEYNIVLVSKKEIDFSKISDENQQIASIESIKTDNVIAKLKDKLSDQSMQALSANLPKFYNIKLKFFPNSDELKQIEENLKKIGEVSKIEVFQKTHDEIFKILLLLKWLVCGFAFLIVLLGLMLIYKQMRIWIFEHRQRIEIMELFGAPFFLKSEKLYRMAIMDSIISAFVVIAFYYFLPQSEIFMSATTLIVPFDKVINLPNDALMLLGSALLISLIAVTLVMIKVESESK